MPYKDKNKKREHDKKYWKQWYQKNKEKIKEQSRQHYQANKEKILEKHKQYKKEHREEIKECNKQWRLDHFGYNKQYYQSHKEEKLEQQKQRRETHPEYMKQWKKDHPERVREIDRKMTAKRRGLGFILLNKDFDGAAAHHMNKEFVVYIPETLHKSIWHNVWTGQGMAEINTLAIRFLIHQGGV